MKTITTALIVVFIGLLSINSAYAQKPNQDVAISKPFKKGALCWASQNENHFYCHSFLTADGKSEEVTMEQIYERGWRVVAFYVDQFQRYNLVTEQQ